MFTFGFYNSYNGDRKYDAVQMSSIFDGIIEDGVFANIGEHFEVVPGDGMKVIVKTGRAWFNHTWNLNDTWMTLDLEPSDILRSRIDSVVLEIDSRTLYRENSIKIIKGELGSNPIAPTMIHADGVDQYRLANVTIKPGVITIETIDIDNKVGMEETPYVVAPIKSIDVSNLYTEWEREFKDWLEDIKSQLAGDVAGNLLLQIQARVKIEDRATEEDISPARDDKWMSPAGMKTVIQKHSFDAVGDITYSANDLEERTNGEYVKMDGRIVDFGSNEAAPKYFKENVVPAIWKPLKLSHTLVRGDGTSGYNSNANPSICGVAVGNIFYYIINEVIEGDVLTPNQKYYGIASYNIVTGEEKKIQLTDKDVVIKSIFPMPNYLVLVSNRQPSSGSYTTQLGYVDINLTNIQYNSRSIVYYSSTTNYSRACSFKFLGRSPDGYIVFVGFSGDYATNGSLTATLYYSNNGTNWSTKTLSFGSYQLNQANSDPGINLVPPPHAYSASAFNMNNTYTNPNEIVLYIKTATSQTYDFTGVGSQYKSSTGIYNWPTITSKTNATSATWSAYMCILGEILMYGYSNANYFQMYICYRDSTSGSGASGNNRIINFGNDTANHIYYPISIYRYDSYTIRSIWYPSRANNVLRLYIVDVKYSGDNTGSINTSIKYFEYDSYGSMFYTHVYSNKVSTPVKPNGEKISLLYTPDALFESNGAGFLLDDDRLLATYNTFVKISNNGFNNVTGAPQLNVNYSMENVYLNDAMIAYIPYDVDDIKYYIIPYDDKSHYSIPKDDTGLGYMKVSNNPSEEL